MSAFKAANPDAVFEDFIRWHSPGDWQNDGGQENGPMHWRIQRMVGLHEDGFLEECLSMEIYGEIFGMMHLLCLLLSRSHSWTPIEKEKR